MEDVEDAFLASKTRIKSIKTHFYTFLHPGEGSFIFIAEVTDTGV
jgi:hypothetical protein